VGSETSNTTEVTGASWLVKKAAVGLRLAATTGVQEPAAVEETLEPDGSVAKAGSDRVV
jgi:hypothetical protein